MKYVINTPEGTQDRLYAQCRERRRVQHALTGLFARRGYAEVSTPEVEFYDLFLRSGSPLPQEQMLKSIDRAGKILVMRPDCTTPIARVAATKLRTLPLPQRLYYDQSVFRSGQEHRGGSSELAQCGIELIGGGGERADLEVLTAAADALRACGLEQFHIELGHAGLFRELTEQAEMPPELVEQMRELIEGKNFAALNDLLEPYLDQAACRALRQLSRLFGGEEVLDEAQELIGESDSLTYLRTLYRDLDNAGYGAYFRFDLGMVHRLDYYTGVVFRGYAEGAGDAVLSGGRYDTLMAAFGRPAEATGFAVDVDAVAACLTSPEPVELECLIHFTPATLKRALEVLEQGPGGSRELSPCGTEAESLALARVRGARELLVLAEGEERSVTP